MKINKEMVEMTLMNNSLELRADFRLIIQVEQLNDDFCNTRNIWLHLKMLLFYHYTVPEIQLRYRVEAAVTDRHRTPATAIGAAPSLAITFHAVL
jgi:hypothetical protein